MRLRAWSVVGMAPVKQMPGSETTKREAVLLVSRLRHYSSVPISPTVVWPLMLDTMLYVQALRKVLNMRFNTRQSAALLSQQSH